MAFEPPFAKGHPPECPAASKTNAIAEVAALDKGCMACAAIPDHNPLASLEWKRFAKYAADVSAFKPKRAISMGCFGKRKGPKTSTAILSQSFTNGSIRFRYERLSPSKDFAVCSIDRCKAAALPSSNG